MGTSCATLNSTWQYWCWAWWVWLPDCDWSNYVKFPLQAKQLETHVVLIAAACWALTSAIHRVWQVSAVLEYVGVGKMTIILFWSLLAMSSPYFALMYPAIFSCMIRIWSTAEVIPNSKIFSSGPLHTLTFVVFPYHHYRHCFFRPPILYQLGHRIRPLCPLRLIVGNRQWIFF